MPPSSERGTKGSERRIQGAHGGIYTNIENPRMSPSSERGAKGSERGTQGAQSKVYTYSEVARMNINSSSTNNNINNNCRNSVYVNNHIKYNNNYKSKPRPMIPPSSERGTKDSDRGAQGVHHRYYVGGVLENVS